MYSGLKLLGAIVSLYLTLTLLSACTESSSSPADSRYTVSYLDRGLSYPVELLANGEVKRLIPGQAFETSVEGGGKLQLSIQSHSPLVQCGFRSRGKLRYRFRRIPTGMRFLIVSSLISC